MLAKLADIAQHIVAGRNGASFHPCHQFVKSLLPYPTVNAAMSRPGYRTLHQQLAAPGDFCAPPVLLLKAERHAKVGSLVQGNKKVRRVMR